MQGVKRVGWVLLALVQTHASFLAAAPQWGSTLGASVGRPLDADYGKPSVLFEPSVSATWEGSAVLSFRSILEQEFSGLRKIQVPVAEALLNLPWFKTATVQLGVFAQGSLLEIENWDTQGAHGRLAAGASVEWKILPSLTLDVSAGPYVGLNSMAAKFSGERFSQGGGLAQIRLMLEWQRFRLEALGLVLEDWNGQWNTRYATFERLSYRVLPEFRVGIAHQLFRNRLDTAGTLGPIGFFDGRRSRVSGFVQWQL